MAQLTIVTTPQNSGDGTPLSTSFNYCNSNFSELYARAQVDPPATLTGSIGDVAGMYASDSTYFYYCFADYDGTNVIWGQVTQVGNITVGSISSGVSNVKIADVNGNATTSIGGISNVVVVSTAGQYVNGLISATGNIRGSYLLGNGSQLTGVATSSNAALLTGDTLSANIVNSSLTSVGTLSAINVTGNVYADKIVASGNIYGDNILSPGNLALNGVDIITSAANLGIGTTILGGYIRIGNTKPAEISIGGNTANMTLTLGNTTSTVQIPGTITSGNITGANLLTGGIISAAGNVSGSNVNTVGNVVAQGVVSASGNIVTTGYFVGNFQGNITGNLVVNGSNTQVLFNSNGNVDAVAGLTYNKDSNILTVLGTTSSQGNVIGGNLVTAGQVSATANITGNYILGNGSQLTGLPALYGNSNVSSFLSAFGSNTISTTGTITSGNITGLNVLTSGLISATGNITGANVLTSGIMSSTGNATHGNILTGGLISATSTITTSANVIGGNLATGGTASAGGNITGANLLTGGLISATGNIRTSAYLFVTSNISGGNISVTNYTGTSSSLSGNVTGGNLTTGGQVSATGNITGNYILGNLSQASGLPPTNTIQSGNSNVLVGSEGGNISINVTGVSPVALFTPLGQELTGALLVTTNLTTGNIINYGYSSVTGNITGGNVLTGGLISASGNITGGGNLTLRSNDGNIVAHDITLGGDVSAGGNITGGNLSVGTGIITVGSIVNANANAVGNIGSSSKYFNTVFAKATSALYADLAENYLADADYAPGTVVIFGGEKEITVTIEAADERVAGVVSTDPAYLMNSGEPGLPVALRGKVPVKVIGPVTKGDSLVTSTSPGVAFSVGRERIYGQAVFAKALESNNSDGEKVIFAVII
jgi:hypothetical protein